MGIRFDQLEIPRWEGVTPDPVDRGPCVLGPGCVIDPPVVLSPMAAVTNPPFRLLCRELGAGLVVTEMLPAKGIAQRDPKALRDLDLRPQEHPVCVQLFGKEPDELAEAARVVQEAGADAVDVNMGCPMKKVVRSGYGAALLRDPDRVHAIFTAMAAAVDIPVTGKMRAGWEDSSAVLVGQAMEDAGAAAVTIHGRTRCDMYDGHADLEVIRQLKEAVSLRVIGNGDVRDHITARRMFSITGCDAVMVARGCLGNPWVFAELAADLRGEPIPPPPDATERAALLRRHVALYVDTYGEAKTCLDIRKHLLWYFRGTPAERALRRALRGIQSVPDIHDAIDLAVRTNAAEVAA